MKFLKALTALTAALALSVSVSAQSRGNLKITGRVLDEGGKPVAQAQVRAAKRGEAQPEVLTAKTNDKGEYTISNLAAGEWVLEGSKEGVGVKEVNATLTDSERTKTLDITIAKPVDPNADMQAKHQEAVKLAQGGDIPGARKIYDDLIAKYPQVYQLHAMMANMYAAENNWQKGAEHIKIALEKEPENVEWKVLHAEMLMEGGSKDEAAKILESVDITKVREARPFTNLAINYINSSKGPEAVDLLTKLIAQFPQDPALLYYRGRAYIAAQKLPEAKADLEKFVAAAPAGAPQLDDAKKLLEQLNKK